MKVSASDQVQVPQKGTKRQRSEKGPQERSPKRFKALLEDDSASDEEGSTSSIDGGAPVNEKRNAPISHGFTVNQEFARRFEHNKRREELQRLEEKYSGGQSGAIDDGSSGSSTDSEEEDDEGILASEILDAQIQDTMEAIRRKDPRVYDEKATFYAKLDVEASNGADRAIKKEKPMYLSDYHRRNLLEGVNGTNVPDDRLTTYVQHQDDLKNSIVKEMHAAASGNQSSSDEGQDDRESVDGFLIRKPSKKTQLEVDHNKDTRKLQAIDVEAAEKDPETFLSNFMSARAWVPSDGARFQPFESDDDEEDRRTELFEEAYNMRFEDPKTSNEKLLSHARDAAAKYSVRKEDKNPRKKAREAERAKKDAAKQLREEEKARLRRLKVAEAEERIRKIKDAAGLRGRSLREEEWSTFLDSGWDDTQWEEEMKKHFDDDYYADNDNDERDEEGNGKRRPRKPRWEDDIDIADLVPDFDEALDEEPQFSLTDDESVPEGVMVQGSDVKDTGDAIAGKTPKLRERSNRKRERDEQMKETRRERRKVERLVDEKLNVEATLSNFGKKHAGNFRYRETSPTAYGLTAQDILMASDSQLNQYAGLKKLAAFRDHDKKRKDKKHLGKKARLRQWRKETFGNERGPDKTLAEVFTGQDSAANGANDKTTSNIDGIEGKKKKPRARKVRVTKN
ncbi:protein KRI1, partial [Lecanoromycetidae sp. Uapishka_2]